MVEADLSADVDLVLTVEEAAEEEVVDLLGDIDGLGLLTDGQAAEEVDDACHCQLHRLERKLVSLGLLSQVAFSLALGSKSLPALLE